MEFYRAVLALEPTLASPYWSHFEIGNVRIGLHPRFAGNDGPLNTRGKGTVLGIEVDDLKAFRMHLEVLGAWCGDWHETPGGVVLNFEDPDGNALQAIQIGSKLELFTV